MRIQKLYLPVLLLFGALVFTACDVTVEGDDQYFLCDEQLSCRDDYVCRLVNGDPACVPEGAAGQFAVLDAGGGTDSDDTESGDAERDTEDASDATGSGCVELETDSGALSDVPSGKTRQIAVVIKNCSATDTLQLESILLDDSSDSAFAILPAGLPGALNNSPVDVGAGQQESFLVTFTPADPGTYTGSIIIESSAPDSPSVLDVEGTGVPDGCPTVDAVGSFDGGTTSSNFQAPPLVIVDLDGTGSSNPSGPDTDLEYEWALVESPRGSTASLVPDGTVAEPELLLDRVGTYEVKLKVYDGDGVAICAQPTSVVIESLPDATVYIELLWDTPGDGDQADGNGSDLDLHYLNPNGRWDMAPFDVFWQNPSPDWGVRNDPSDDPELLVDAANGLGPEAINHSDLDGLKYKIGVHYYVDREFGPSYANVRVYVDGDLRFEATNGNLPETGSFWEVASVEGSAGMVTGINQTYTDFPD